MKARLRFFICFFATLLATFLLMKVVFMLYKAAGLSFAAADVFGVIIHGLPLVLTSVSYLSILRWLAMAVSLWYTGPWLRRILNIYACIVASLLAIILVVDCVLYDFWDFKIDATIFNYMDNPRFVLANVSWWFVLVGLLCIAALAWAMIWVLRRVNAIRLAGRVRPWKGLAIFVLLGGCLFLMIRGGVGRSTMNIGHVYYSPDQFLNHSAQNPAFTLIYSSIKYQNLDGLYNYYPAPECKANFEEMKYSTQSLDTDTLLNTSRPNIVLVLMEGLGATFIEPLGGEKGITPNLNQLANEGVLFTRCYANSFRTDRGTISTLSGFTAFPDVSVMKMPNEAVAMPSVAMSLALEGYDTRYLYGGDKNFTSANSYLLATGFARVDGDEVFPLAVRRTHSWGVTDVIVFDTLYNYIMRQPKDRPFFITCQTLASHEDWKVPYNRIADNPKANAMAYLDDCIGRLVSRLRQTEVWQDLLLICIPDHGISYPPGNTEADIERCHIPIIMAGGAVASHRVINQICNQTDLPATLLGQLGINHDEFIFSRDVLSKTYTYPCALHTFSRGVTFIDSTGITIEDLNSNKTIVDTPSPNPDRLRYAHTLLQVAMNELADE